jgi:transposase
MRLNKQEREFFRKLLDQFIVKNPHFKRCQVVDHFVNEGIARQTVYNAKNRRENGQSILEDTRPGRPSSWTSSMKAKLKRLVNNRKGVSQRKLGKKFNKHHTTIGRQIQKLV